MHPWAEPIRHTAGASTAVLLCHGFTGTPGSLGRWPDRFAADGLDVSVPRLPGHGTDWRDLNRTGWHDWYACVERELLTLGEAHDQVFVGGLSMGGALALHLAQQYPALVAGLMLVNPAVILTDPRLRALPVLRRFIGSLPGLASDIAKSATSEPAYDRTPLTALASTLRLFATVRADLDQVTAPVIMFRSPQDHVVPPASPLLVLERISSTDVTDVVLTRSFHVATLDHDADLVSEQSARFVQRLTRVGAR